MTPTKQYKLFQTPTIYYFISILTLFCGALFYWLWPLAAFNPSVSDPLIVKYINNNPTPPAYRFCDAFEINLNEAYAYIQANSTLNPQGIKLMNAYANTSDKLPNNANKIVYYQLYDANNTRITNATPIAYQLNSKMINYPPVVYSGIETGALLCNPINSTGAIGLQNNVNNYNHFLQATSIFKFDDHRMIQLAKSTINQITSAGFSYAKIYWAISAAGKRIVRVYPINNNGEVVQTPNFTLDFLCPDYCN
jgi:hypothetical protein